MSSRRELEEGVWGRANMKEFEEFQDKIGCSVWDELWVLKKVLHGPSTRKLK